MQGIQTRKLTLLASSVLAALCFSTTTHAATYGFGCIAGSGSSATDCAIAEAQILMDVSEVSASQVAFTFSNTGPAQSSIEGIYFDNGTLLGISYLIDRDEGVGGMNGVDFTAGSASPPNLPRANNLTPAFETTAGFLTDSDSPTSRNGVNPNEWLTVVFNLRGGGNYTTVLAELASGEVRVGLHVIDFASGGSESLINETTPVPLPAAALLFMSGLAGAGFAGRRRR